MTRAPLRIGGIEACGPQACEQVVGIERGVLAHALHALAPQHAHVDVGAQQQDRKSTRLNSSHLVISYAVFCLKKKALYHPCRPSCLPTMSSPTRASSSSTT